MKLEGSANIPCCRYEATLSPATSTIKRFPQHHNPSSASLSCVKRHIFHLYSMSELFTYLMQRTGSDSAREPSGLAHGNRGRPPANKLDEKVAKRRRWPRPSILRPDRFLVRSPWRLFIARGFSIKGHRILCRQISQTVIVVDAACSQPSSVTAVKERCSDFVTNRWFSQRRNATNCTSLVDVTQNNR